MLCNINSILAGLPTNVNAVAGSMLWITTLTGCGGGSSASAPVAPIVPVTTTTSGQPASTNVTNDNRHYFETFSIDRYPNTPGYSDVVTQTYSMSEYKDTGLPLDTQYYKIADYGFFQSTVSGVQPGFDYGEESQASTHFWQGSNIYRAELNGDGFEDFYITINVGHDKNSFKPGDYVFAFINDGYGNFILSTEIFPEGIPCLRGSAEPCNDSEHLKSTVVADFNGDGLDDFYQGTTLLLSDNGYYYDMRDTHLPIEFFERFMPGENNSMGFTHDAHAADADGDGDIDIFIPYASPMKDGSMTPWVLLVNDGTGYFDVNTNFPFEARNLFATAAVIGDFNNDGYSDVAVGWFDPSDAKNFGMSQEHDISSGIILWNDGNNRWDTLNWTELPDGFFGTNNNVNDIKTIDFNNDGLLDIVVASTKHEPYYDGRAVQFFANNGDSTFSDVTSSVSPDREKYADGINNGYWNGDGTLSVLDLDNDGDLDIFDSSRGSYALVNDNGVFNLFDDFPKYDENSKLFPVDINGTGAYDFIGYIGVPNGDQNTLTYFQILDLL